MEFITFLFAGRSLRLECVDGDAQRMAGFAVFHTAFVLIIAAAFARSRTSRTLLRIAFPIVSLGATAAVFAEPAVERYRIPVIAFAVLGAVGMMRARLERLARSAA